MDIIDNITKKYLKNDFPSLKIGDKVEVITIYPTKKQNNREEKDRLIINKGIVIAQKNIGKISHNFKIISDKGNKLLATKTIISYNSPLTKEIKLLGRITGKIRRAKCNYLWDRLSKKINNK